MSVSSHIAKDESRTGVGSIVEVVKLRHEVFLGVPQVTAMRTKPRSGCVAALLSLLQLADVTLGGRLNSFGIFDHTVAVFARPSFQSR
jgi:hypothetical protein